MGSDDSYSSTLMTELLSYRKDLPFHFIGISLVALNLFPAYPLEQLHNFTQQKKKAS